MPNINEFRTYVKSLNDNLALGNARRELHMDIPTLSQSKCYFYVVLSPS